MDIGTKIKEMRKDKKLTQQQLADMISVTRSSLQKYENGETAITIELLENIAAALNVDIISFFTDDVDDILILLKKRFNLKDNSKGQLEYDFRLFIDFLRYKYR
ncbi:helix-turn-helix domain-containing protein [Cellulosilyticum sp. I15G10I2]|uniref:helix-turn-helix domain-containing protein n=1 Tax=Cellulosilyticum sp. I15G10I2 TaxID=1892843 RepID=UPI00085BFB2C|nr:helix-turn-helix transcriptional regulator [Cellulosilyticum sp. I15G10I2]